MLEMGCMHVRGLMSYSTGDVSEVVFCLHVRGEATVTTHVEISSPVSRPSTDEQYWSPDTTDSTVPSCVVDAK